MNLPLFVGREKELSELEMSTSAAESNVLYSVIGPTGIGKSTLLSNFANSCRNQDIPVLEYRIREPSSADQFFTRLVEQWQDVHPDALSGPLRGLFYRFLGNTGQAIASTPGSGFVGSGVGALLKTFGEVEENREETESTDFSDKVCDLAKDTKEHTDSDTFVLIIDQFDEARIDSDVYDEIARILRDISASSPHGLVCCVGAQERFYKNSQPYINELELQPFDAAAIETYLRQSNLDPSQADEVRRAASGNPYFVERIVQIAHDKGSISDTLTDLSSVDEERYQRLEERFFGILEEDKRHILLKTCALPELRIQSVSYVTGQERQEVEEVLQELQHQTVLTRVGYDQGKPVYRVHDLQQDYLKDRLDEEGRIQQHSRAAAYYAERAVKCQPGSVSEWLVEDGEERLREFMTSGILFEYHLQKLPSHIPVNDRVELVLGEVEHTDPIEVQKTLRSYFQQYQPMSFSVEELGVARQVPVNEITGALGTDTGSASPLKLAQLYKRIGQEERLTSAESEILVLFMETLRRTKPFEDSNTDGNQEKANLVEEQIQELEGEKYEDTPPLYFVVNSLLRWWHSFLANGGETTQTVDVWAYLESTYGLTMKDWERIKELASLTFSVLVDLEFIGQISREYEEEQASESKVLEDHDSIEQYGLEGGLSRTISSPLLLIPSALNNPTSEEIEELTKRWLQMEEKFDEEGHSTIASLCGDVHQAVLKPLREGGPDSSITLRLISAFNVENFKSLEKEPASSILRVARSLNGIGQ